MNLQPLFEAQKKLDEHIEKSKGLEGQNLLDKKILALQVELGELANEWRGFKFWSENQRPNTEQWVECTACDGTGDLNYEMVQEEAEGNGGHEYIDCEECDSSGTTHMINPLLEEYADGLHFILSIGNDLNINVSRPTKLIQLAPNINVQFNAVFQLIAMLDPVTLLIDDNAYRVLLNNYFNLGESLGFTTEQIEQAYFAKNEENHRRQENGY